MKMAEEAKRSGDRSKSTDSENSFEGEARSIVIVIQISYAHGGF